MAAFSLSEPQHQRQAEVRALAREVLAPIAAAGRPGRVNRELVRALGEHGLIAVLVPPRQGGPAPSALDLCLLREALAQETTKAETALGLQGLGGHPIAVAATEPVARRWLPAIVAGEAVAAFALSEAAAGADAAGLELAAAPDGDGWRLPGEKAWISNAPDADVYTVFARTTPGARSQGITAFAVPGDAEGLRGEPLELLASHAVSHTLAEMATRIEAARLLVYAAASRHDQGAEGSGALAAMAKLHATETAQWVVDAAVQIHGARALQRGHLLEHLYREVRAPRIYEGTSEIQRTVIARALLREGGSQ